MRSLLKISISLLTISALVLGCAPAENNTITVSSSTLPFTADPHSQSPARSQTPTSYPTPVAVSVEQIVQAYFHIGEGNTCKLPCYLGINPGRTLWQDTENLFKPFSVSTRFGLEGKYGQFAAIVLDKQNKDLELRFQVGVDNKTIYLIEMSNETPLAEYLSTLGLPDQVLIDSAGTGGIGNSFNLAIAYFKRGVIAYLSGEFQIVDGKAQVCSDQLKNIQMIVLWSPADIQFIGELVNLDGYVGIESASNTTIKEFYNNYSDNNSIYCIGLNY